MDFNFHHWFHNTNSGEKTLLELINKKIDNLTNQGVKLMAKADELLAELEAANETTNEIASDLNDLIAKLAGGLTEAEAETVKAEIVALGERLKAVASTHTA